MSIRHNVTTSNLMWTSSACGWRTLINHPTVYALSVLAYAMAYLTAPVVLMPLLNKLCLVDACHTIFTLSYKNPRYVTNAFLLNAIVTILLVTYVQIGFTSMLLLLHDSGVEYSKRIIAGLRYLRRYIFNLAVYVVLAIAAIIIAILAGECCIIFLDYGVEALGIQGILVNYAAYIVILFGIVECCCIAYLLTALCLVNYIFIDTGCSSLQAFRHSYYLVRCHMLPMFVLLCAMMIPHLHWLLWVLTRFLIDAVFIHAYRTLASEKGLSIEYEPTTAT